MSRRNTILVLVCATLPFACKQARSPSSAEAPVLRSTDIDAIEATLDDNEAQLRDFGVQLALAELPDDDAGDPAPTTPPEVDLDETATGAEATEDARDDANSVGTSADDAPDDAERAPPEPTASAPPPPLDEGPSRRKKRAEQAAARTRCDRICDLADATCSLADQICGLASEHTGEMRYQDACMRAQDQCRGASRACTHCD